MYGKGEMETGRQNDRINMKCVDKKRQSLKIGQKKESTGAKEKLEEAEIQEMRKECPERERDQKMEGYDKCEMFGQEATA